MLIDEPADISGIVEEYGLQRHIAELDEIRFYGVAPH